MTEIIPGVLVKSEKEFEKNLRAVENDCKTVQIDVLDGSLFGNTTWYDPKAIGALKTKVSIEAHLMVENPIPIVEEFKKLVPTFKRAIIHAEIHRQLGAVVGHIKDVLGLEVGVAINPETPLHEIESVLHVIDQLTVMGVHPGSQGQMFESVVIDKIKMAREHCPDLIIEIDGGITNDLINPLIKAGVNRLLVGSLIFKSDDPTAKLKELNSKI